MDIVANVVEISWVLSKRGKKQLVYDNKIYQLNKSIKNEEGRIITRHWKCNQEAFCSAKCCTKHAVTPDDSFEIQHITSITLSGQHLCETSAEDVGNKRYRQA